MFEKMQALCSRFSLLFPPFVFPLVSQDKQGTRVCAVLSRELKSSQLGRNCLFLTLTGHRGHAGPQEVEE